ncbi:hypothetical protein EDD30_0390 [Couchioplanes caeruleus]|uniref:Uncharacterized protein n=1 Tax=Couchioplanes caeruleus TaxID=56438 RepID=A0A3N1GBS3_9ACTN|nr:hypothetical protein EDD30_0390 [Couchioplanes caeruleus]
MGWGFANGEPVHSLQKRVALLVGHLPWMGTVGVYNA